MLGLIEKVIAETGRAPTYREMADELGLSTLSSIHRVVTALEERGFIERVGERGAPRAIKVIQPQTHLNPEYLRGYQDGFVAAMRQSAD